MDNLIGAVGIYHGEKPVSIESVFCGVQQLGILDSILSIKMCFASFCDRIRI